LEIFLVTIFIVGIISAVFGVLLIFAPDVILRVEEKANILYMTDTAFLKNRIPLGIAMLGISAFLSYTYSIITINEITFLLIAIVAGIFGILLLVSPNTILIMERQANKIYMTDTFFFENRVVIGIALLLASGFMIKTYLSFS
jgi:hypothetical protein|tara:strand:+ start:208 stop:636 length:429 start_codon:yes stop_codon:yes gene_type:complete